MEGENKGRDQFNVELHRLRSRGFETEGSPATRKLSAVGNELESAISQAVDALVVYDQSLRYTYINDSGAALLNLNPNQIIGKTNREIIGPAADAIDPYVKKAFEGGEKVCVIHEISLPEGVRLFDTVYTPMIDDQGRLDRVVGVCRDITEDRLQLEKLEKAVKIKTEAFESSERRYRDLVDNASEGILVAQDEKIVFANPISIKFTGYTSHELLSKPFTELIHPDDRSKVNHYYQKRLQGDAGTFRYTLRFFNKAGETKWVAMNTVMISWDGKPAVLCLITDITEQKATEEALKASEEFNRSLVEHSPMAIVYLDADGNLEYTNPASNRIFSIPESESSPIIGINLFSLPLIAEQPHLIDLFKRLLQGEPQQNIELDYQSPLSGRRYTLLATATPRISPEGTVQGASVMFMDISERKQAEVALRESEQRYRQLTQHSLTGIYIHQEGRFVYVNDRLAAMLGYKPEEMIGEQFWKFVHPDDRQRIKDRGMAISQGQLYNSQAQFRALCKSGEIKWLEVLSATISHNGQPANMGNVADITERKKMEDTIRDIVSGVSSEIGEAFFQSTVKHFAKILEADYTLIGKLIEKETGANIQTIAFFGDGAVQENFEYTYQGAPCEIALRDGVCAYEMGVADLFPKDTTLRKWEIEGYVGVCLYDSHQQKMGIMAAMSREPVRNIAFAESILKIFAARTAAEIERMRSEEALGLAEFSVARTSDAVFWIGPDAHFQHVNEAACKALGYSEEELLRMTVHDIDPNFTVSVWPNHWRNLKAHGSMTVESIHRRKDGTVFPVEISVNYLQHGGKEYNFAYARDISDRKGAEAALMRSEATLSSILRVAPTGIGIVSDRVITWANQQFCAMLGYELEELIGQSARIVYPTDEDYEYVGREKYEQISERGTGTVETHWRRKDGRIIEVLLSSTPLDPSDLSVGVTFTALDITEHKHLEEQLRHAAKMEAIGTLAGGIAHDFNNLLQVIQGYSDMALLNIEKGQVGHSELLEIRSAAKSAAQLTQGLLAFSRKLEGQLTQVDLNRELIQIKKMLARTIPRMIEIELNLADDLKPVKSDPGQLQQAVMNLAVNARDAMPDGGRLVIETANVYLGKEYFDGNILAKPGNYVLLAVSDSGTGMDEDTLDKMFDPFFTTKEVGKGTGLGLSIVFGIVKNHGGAMSCHSEPGVGTTFKIYLPVIGQAQDYEEEDKPDILIGGDEIILLVDDEDAVRRLGESILRRFGYTILMAGDGKEALDIYRKQKEKISLVILDLIMPKMGGRECLRELLSINPNVKVLIATGYAADGQIDATLEEGAKASIRKPYNVKQMLTKVRRVLDESEDR